MKLLISSVVFSAILLAGCSQSPSQNVAASAGHTAGASVNTVGASGHGVAASGQVASGAVALPFKAVGAVGKASNNAGDKLLDASGMSKPLPISEQAVSAGAPPKTE